MGYKLNSTKSGSASLFVVEGVPVAPPKCYTSLDSVPRAEHFDTILDHFNNQLMFLKKIKIKSQIKKLKNSFVNSLLFCNHLQINTFESNAITTDSICKITQMFA